MGYGVGHRGGSDLLWLWLWRRLAAVAMIPPLPWELPYAMGETLKKKKEELIPERGSSQRQPRPFEEGSLFDHLYKLVESFLTSSSVIEAGLHTAA